jgi:hypothetical protein
MSYACGKRYCVCVTCMLWCSDTESVPLLVSSIHDIILVHTVTPSHFELVCNTLYCYSYPVPVCTRYVPVRTGLELVRTKYPVPVLMRLTIKFQMKPAGAGPRPDNWNPDHLDRNWQIGTYVSEHGTDMYVHVH